MIVKAAQAVQNSFKHVDVKWFIVVVKVNMVLNVHRNHEAY